MDRYAINAPVLNRLVLRRSSDWLTFDRPRSVLTARCAGDVADLLREIHDAVDRGGLYAAGYLGYEAAPAFDDALRVKAGRRMPLACFGLFDEPVRGLEPRTDRLRSTEALEWHLATDRNTYIERIAAIKRQIELGNSYQVNYTIRQHGRLPCEPWHLFLNIALDAPYAAYIDCDDHAIVSASPELFFSLTGSELVSRPMKGTARRGLTAADDRAAQQALVGSEKNRAENIMITDMVRNDIGRVAVAGSVGVDALVQVEKHPTVWQMTSTVRARTRAALPDILEALFPCASITGAPKASSMAIIADLEDSPREIYTGTIGFFAPSREAQFNVAIRTAWIDKESYSCTYGIGGGIVWDSDPDDEFEECRTKARILNSTAADRDFCLLETMRWTQGDGYFLLDLHIERLAESAEYFEFRFDRTRILDELARFAKALTGHRHRVRLVLDRDGTLDLQQAPAPPDIAEPLRICPAEAAVDPGNVFLYHKTTRRNVYERARRSASGCDDVLLYNSDGFVTETSIANVVIELDGDLVTPPVSCGLLGGVLRRKLLADGTIRERAIRIDELPAGQPVTLINSLRGRYPAVLEREFTVTVPA